MIIDVPLIRQPKDSVDCGIAGITMILAHHGINRPFDDVKKDIMTDHTGTYAPQLGTYLIKQGFDVEIVTMHPGLFTKKHLPKDSNDSKAHFQGLMPKTSKEQDRKVIGHFIEFLSAGGLVRAKRPTEKDLLSEIGQGRPVGALLTTNFLSEEEPKFNFHFNVITGIDVKKVYVNDPMWDKRGGKKTYLIEDFFFGLYASSYGDLDNGCLIMVRPKGGMAIHNQG
ncbi:MAG: cysteine peptidase family C39 domain-containing protein [Nanoarchaeota archaeon]